MKTIRIDFFILIAVLNMACLASKAPEPADVNIPVTLQDYLSYAALNNAGLKAAFEEWKSALEQIPQVKVLPDPHFTYGYYIQEVETKPSPQSQQFQLMQVFPWFGTIEARTDAAASTAKAAKKRYESAKLKLFFEVKEAFFEYSYLARAIEIAKQNLQLARHFEEVARTKYTTSEVTHPDIIRAQVELAKMADELKALEEFRKPLSARLISALNRKDFDLLPWPVKEKFQAVTLDRQQLIEHLRSNNPELGAFSFELEGARTRIELAKKRFYPDIGVGVEWMTNEAMMGDNLRDSQKDEVVLMFGLNLPIWRKSYRAGQLQAKAEFNKTLHLKKEAENNLIAQAAQALYDFEDSDRKRRLYEDILIPKVQELLGASEQAYKTGKIDFLSLIDAQQKVLEYQLRYERAVTDNQQKLAELEMLAGTELQVVSKAGKTSEK